VLDPDRIAQLQALTAYGHHHQYTHYCLVGLSSYHDGMALRLILDPFQFILQRNLACTNLELNFNPTREQVDFLRKMQKLMLSAPIHQIP
jgi:hypothetical protein